MQRTEEVNKWLNQFNGSDKFLATTLLNNLTLISYSEFAKGITLQIQNIAKKSPGKCALIPIRKIQNTKYRDENKEYRKSYSSADSIGYLLTEIERLNNRIFSVEPTINSMRVEKIKNIILVDDIIGTGSRIITFWKQLDKSIKSWISYKKCKIWIVTYAAHQTGINTIKTEINPLMNTNIYNELLVNEKNTIFNIQLESLCMKYAKKTSKPNAGLGYGENRNLILFEFSCPNNSPAILWANGKEWTALFPNRAIPIALKPLFNTNGKDKQLNLIFDANQQELAIQIMDAIEHNNITDNYFYILTILGFIQKGFKHKSLETLIILNKSSFDKLINDCLNNRLIDQINMIEKKYKLTIWGKDLLIRYKHKNIVNIKEKDFNVYYPLQFRNIPAKI